MQVGGVFTETEVNRPVEPLVERIHRNITYLPGQHVDDHVDISILAELPTMVESVTVVDCDVDATNYAAMRLHVVHMHIMSSVRQSARDVGAHEPGP